MSFRRALCGAVKNRDGDFTHGAVVVVLNADGKAFLAHNMVLCDDDQWTCELVGFPAQARHVYLRS